MIHIPLRNIVEPLNQTLRQIIPFVLNFPFFLLSLHSLGILPLLLQRHQSLSLSLPLTYGLGAQVLGFVKINLCKRLKL